MSQNTVPEGYMRNALGHLVPLDQVREQDLLRDQVAKTLAAEAIELNQRLKNFKARALGDIAGLVQIAGERYGARMGGDKGNVTVSTYDGSLRVQRSVAEKIAFTEEILAAKTLITQCIDRWSEGANANYRALVDRAFKTDASGRLKTSSILDLLRLEIEDEDWKNAMRAIHDSIQAVGTSTYVRVYQRVGDSDQYESIPLDLAAV